MRSQHLIKLRNNRHEGGNFWFGFSLGTIVMALLAYFFGTKHGRSLLKQMMDFTENLEENLQLLIEKQVEKQGNNSNQLETSHKSTLVTSLETIIDKIKKTVRD